MFPSPFLPVLDFHDKSQTQEGPAGPDATHPVWAGDWGQDRGGCGWKVSWVSLEPLQLGLEWGCVLSDGVVLGEENLWSLEYRHIFITAPCSLPGETLWLIVAQKLISPCRSGPQSTHRPAISALHDAEGSRRKWCSRLWGSCSGWGGSQLPAVFWKECVQSCIQSLILSKVSTSKLGRPNENEWKKFIMVCVCCHMRCWPQSVWADRFAENGRQVTWGTC